MSNVVKGPTHNGPAPEFTGGRHPRGKLAPGDKTGTGVADPEGATAVGPDGARHAGVKGYTVLGASPVSDAKPHGNLTSDPVDHTLGSLIKGED